MRYTVTSDTVGLAVGPVSETANDVHEALSKARQMYETGLVNVSIKDQTALSSQPPSWYRSRQCSVPAR